MHVDQRNRILQLGNDPAEGVTPGLVRPPFALCSRRRTAVIASPCSRPTEQYTAEIFDQAGIAVLRVGDSASNNVFGNETSLPVTVDELLPLRRAVSRAAKRALVVADLPFGS